jgi:hypothetical protein
MLNDLEVAEPARSSRHALDQPAFLRDLHRCFYRFDRVAALGHERWPPGIFFTMLFFFSGLPEISLR